MSMHIQVFVCVCVCLSVLTLSYELKNKTRKEKTQEFYSGKENDTVSIRMPSAMMPQNLKCEPGSSPLQWLFRYFSF